MINDYGALAVMSLMIFIAVLALLMKLTPRVLLRTLGYDVWVDAIAFVALKSLLFGTATGMILAFGGGLLFSIILIIAKQIFGYEKLKRVRCCACGHAPLTWVYHPPRWRAFAPRFAQSVRS